VGIDWLVDGGFSVFVAVLELILVEGVSGGTIVLVGGYGGLKVSCSSNRRDELHAVLVGRISVVVQRESDVDADDIGKV
jgi:hypothetical protein